MTQISIRSGPVPMNLELGAALRLDDAELFELCSRNPGLRIERTVHVFRPDRAIEILDRPDAVEASPDLSGFRLPLGPLWAE